MSTRRNRAATQRVLRHLAASSVLAGALLMPSLASAADKDAACKAYSAVLPQNGAADFIPEPCKRKLEQEARSRVQAADKAVARAERIVARSPRDMGARSVLAHAYLMAGRFASAQSAFDEAVSLGDTSPRTALGLSLAEIANHREHDAVALLDQNKDALPASDLGLALALAGETGRGVAVLVDAVRAGDASPKLRQNLAFAYALDGRWADARMAMAIDTPPDQIDLRLNQWAAAMKSDGGRERVAGLLGVALINDAGMPRQLALNAAPVRQLAVADSTPAPAPAAAVPALGATSASFVPDDGHELPPVQTGSADPAPAQMQVAMADSAPAPVQAAVDSTPAEPAAAAPARPAHAVRHPRGHASITVPAPASQPAAVAVNGGHVIQLGAFSSAANAQRAKAKFLASDGSLSGHDLLITKVAVNGRAFWRVTAGGYGAASAYSACSAMRASGGACLAYAAGREKFAVPTHLSGRAMAQAAPKAAPARVAVKVRTAQVAPKLTKSKPAPKGALAMVSPVSGK